MRHRGTWLVFGCLLTVAASRVLAEPIQGDYLETRTCDVYTGPCFANAEVSLAGEEAIMAWKIDRGSHHGVDLSGLSVVMAVRGSDTLGFRGPLRVNPDNIRSVVLVDERASAEQREALVAFATQRAGEAAGSVVRVEAVPISLELDHVDMVGKLSAGGEVELLTRKMGSRDCVCTNEAVFYPPLTLVDNAEPAYTVEGRFSGRGLGAQWANPLTRSSFLGTFGY